ncbi:hypothetical protein PHMEG_00033496 [Phytophthora megakarya]|uniref:Uncharacterized protein n=1 Tax=Phytophthora megakarya TaxID=4795 RepID=A0A225UTX0_9STRA|nr:hypothetical protein PHMEG_00033496 [Phytophthora megakarya]
MRQWHSIERPSNCDTYNSSKNDLLLRHLSIDRPSTTGKQQQAMRRQMEKHRQYIEEQYKLLKAVEEAVGLHGQRIERLAEAVQPHLQARWGAF